jgi:siroheme decarboxylase
MTTAEDLRLIERLHGGLPLVDRPYAAVGAELGMDESDVIARLERLLTDGVLTRFGPLFQIERAGGCFVLCAMAVPAHRFDAVAAIVNARAEVAHNYRREHALNMWFVAAAESPEAVEAALRAIERDTGLDVLRFPKEREYFVELRLPLREEACAIEPGSPSIPQVLRQAQDARSPSIPQGERIEFMHKPVRAEVSKPQASPSIPQGERIKCMHKSVRAEVSKPQASPSIRAQHVPCPEVSKDQGERIEFMRAGSISDVDRALVLATQGGLPLVPRPFDEVGARLGVSGQQVRERLAQMIDAGLVRRIGAVPNHYRLGFVANGMTVWDVDDERVDALGAAVGALPGVSHCYRRPRRAPLWRYNLFAMLHGKSREQVEAQRRDVRALLGDACRADDILYSTAILKKTGLRIKETS